MIPLYLLATLLPFNSKYSISIPVLKFDDFLSSKPPLVNPFGGMLERKLFHTCDGKIKYDVSYSEYYSELGLSKYCEE